MKLSSSQSTYFIDSLQIGLNVKTTFLIKNGRVRVSTMGMTPTTEWRKRRTTLDPDPEIGAGDGLHFGGWDSYYKMEAEAEVVEAAWKSTASTILV